MLSSTSNQARVLFALHDLADQEGFSGYDDDAPQACHHWAFMEEATGLSQQAICRTLVGLAGNGLVIAVPTTADSGAHLGQAWISPAGINAVDGLRSAADPVPVTISGIAPDVVHALRGIVQLAEEQGVEDKELNALRQRVEAVERAPDPETKLAKAADVMTLVTGSQSLMTFFVAYVLPLLR